MRQRRKRRIAAIAVGALLLVAALLGSAANGAVYIPPGEVVDTLMGYGSPESQRILTHIRIPRLITGALTGANLALAGCILQGLLRNPLADPGILGVSAGAGLAAMCIMILVPAYAALASRLLNALQLGEETARSLGVRVQEARIFLLLLSALLAASAVSAAGMLGFVGLVVPHLVRLMTGSDFTWLMPVSAIWGAALVVGADVTARMAFAPVEVPVGVFLSFLGAPFFLYLLRKGMKGGSA